MNVYIKKRHSRNHFPTNAAAGSGADNGRQITQILPQKTGGFHIVARRVSALTAGFCGVYQSRMFGYGRPIPDRPAPAAGKKQLRRNQNPT